MISYDTIRPTVPPHVHCSGLTEWAVARGLVDASDRIKEASKAWAHVEIGQQRMCLLTGRMTEYTGAHWYDTDSVSPEVVTAAKDASGIVGELDSQCRARMEEIIAEIARQQSLSEEIDRQVGTAVSAATRRDQAALAAAGHPNGRLVHGTPVPGQATVYDRDGQSTGIYIA